MQFKLQIKRKAGELTDRVDRLEITVYGHDLSTDEEVVYFF